MDNTYKHILKHELNKRKKINSSYSLRAFAKHLNLGSSALSEIISGKRNISLKKAQTLVDKLSLSPKDEKIFMNSVKNTKAKFKNDIALNFIDDSFSHESLETHEIISSWEHLAILNLVKVDSFKYCARDISIRLSISLNEVNAAIERLLNLGLLKVEHDKLIRTVKQISYPSDIPSSSIRFYHKQLLEKSIYSLEKDDLNKRDITAITMAIDESLIPEAKQKIRNFRRELCTFLEGKKSNRVYNLNIQLIPLEVERSNS